MYYAKYIISAKSRVLYLVVLHIGNYMGIFLCDKAKKCIQKMFKIIPKTTDISEREREREHI